MTSVPFAMQRLSTLDVPQRDRMAFIHDFVGRHVGGQHFRLLDDENADIRMALMPLPGELSLGRVDFPPIHGMRTRDLLGDGRERYMLTLHHADFEVSIEGREIIKVPAGGMTMTSEAIHSEYHYLTGAKADVLMLDPKLLAKLAPRVELEALYVLPPTVAGMPLLKAYSDTLRANPPASLKAGEMASRHLYDLAALVLDGFVRGGAERNEHSIAGARLRLIRQDVLAGLSDQTLNIEDVARRQGVTARYVQRLFEAEGTTFSDYVRERRLELAYQLLQQSGLGIGTIAAVAFDAGFSDISSFNRAFRRRFDATPSEIKARAAMETGISSRF